MISVIIPNYNCGKYISRCLNSVLSQTYCDFEIIVIDDGSTDDSIEIIRLYAEKNSKIVLIEQNDNKGVYAARYAGIEKARGEYIAFLDADDYWEKNKLEKQIKMAQNTGAPFIFSGALCVDEYGRNIKKYFSAPELIGYEDMIKRNSIVCSSALIKKELVEKIAEPIGIFHEDYYMWLQILQQGQLKAIGIDEPLVNYTIRKKQKSGNKIKSAIAHYKTLRYCHVTFIQCLKGTPAYLYQGLKRYFF